MGALRRPELDYEERVEVRPEAQAERPRLYPRWIVVSSVIVYCSVFWVLVWMAGSVGIDWVRTAQAGN